MTAQNQFAFGLLAALTAATAFCAPALAGDQAKAIVNSIDPKIMNEFVEAAQARPDVSLANLVPAGANKYRFLIIWPSKYQSMTQDRIGQSFAQRFMQLANQQKLLANGYCLLSQGMSFGTTSYAGESLDVAYRDIEVRYMFGPSGPCRGRYIAASDFFRDLKPSSPSARETQGHVTPPRSKLSPSAKKKTAASTQP